MPYTTPGATQSRLLRTRRISRGFFHLTPFHPSKFYARHGDANALELADRNGIPLLVALLDVRWSNETDDDTINLAAKTLFDKIEVKTRELAAYDPFIYLNYAGPDQSSVLSYGQDTVRRLQTVQDRVDPTKMFTKMVFGGQKIPSV
ncbi:hypothetical protein E8E14_013598 [Neopestalotiopsis sp. 37M]|nr:hypothetical protein E8E14_013598 [Neopestalotiopsis sp. 37M]